MAKKLNKAETVDQARRDARTDEAVTSMTVETLESMDYAGRFTAAQYAAQKALDALDTVTKLNHGDAYASAYVSAVQGAWGTLMKQRENARREWRRLLASKNLSTANAELRTLITAMGIRGARIDGGYNGLTVRIERSFGVGADLYIRIEREDGLASLTGAGLTNPDHPEQRGGYHTVRTEISWSGTTRTLAESVASVKLYAEVVDAAAEIEAVMARERIKWTWNVPEPEATPEPATDVFNAENA